MLHEQLKRRPVPRSSTQNEPREKENEHTSTANTSDEGAHFNSGYGTAKSGIRLSRTHRTYARKRTKTDRVTALRYPKSKKHRQQGVTDRKPTGKCAKLWLVSCKDCVHHADLQQPKRSSPRQKWNCLCVDKREAALSGAPRHVLQNTTQDLREAERNNGPHDRMMPNKCEATSLWRVLRACAPHADLQHAAAARRRSTLAQQPRARPEVSIVKREEVDANVMCLATLRITLGPAMIDTQQLRPAARR